LTLEVSIETRSTDEGRIAPEPSPLQTTAVGFQDIEPLRRGNVGPDTVIDTAGWFSPGGRTLELKEHHGKIEPVRFSFSNPWLPPNAMSLLNKLKKGPISERELVQLMDLVTERATVHFQVEKGKFAAMTFHGQIVELSDTRADLLKNIQGRKFPEEIFVCRIGFEAFSGRT
jgi:hypothetical protein